MGDKTTPATADVNPLENNKIIVMHVCVGALGWMVTLCEHHPDPRMHIELKCGVGISMFGVLAYFNRCSNVACLVIGWIGRANAILDQVDLALCLFLHLGIST